MPDYFSSVFNSEDTDGIPSLNKDPLPNIPSIQVNSHGIQYLLSNLDANKSSDPDSLPARFLKEVAVEIAPALSIVFQVSLDQGVLLNVWKTASIVPVHKKGSRTDCNNYTTISFTCICSEVLEYIM